MPPIPSASKPPVLMSSKPIRLALAGCGDLVRWRHLPTLARSPDFDVVAVVDRDPAAVDGVRRDFGVPRGFASIPELLADGGVDAVAVCTPPTTHAELGLAVLNAGLPLFMEKPVAVSLRDADALIEGAAKAGVPTLMGFNLRWHRLLGRAREQRVAGALGWVHALTSVFSDPLVRKELPPWRSDRRSGGGVVFDRAVHHFDLWRHLLGQEVEEVYAVGRSRHRDDDAAVVTARMSDGAIASGLFLDDSVVRHEVSLYGSEGGVEVDVFRFDGYTRNALEEYPGSVGTRLRRLRARLSDPLGDLASIRKGGDFDATYVDEWRHFAEVVRGTATPGATLEDGRAALAVSVAVSRSIDIGRPVRLDTVEDDE